MSADETKQTDQFMRLFLANRRRIYGLVLTLVPNYSDADDLLQEVSSQMWLRFADFDASKDFGAWAMQFARNVVANFHRRKASASVISFNDELLELVADEATKAINQSDRRQEALRECLKAISPRGRQLIEQRYGVGETVEKIAASVGRSASMVYKALSQIHLTLQRCIERKLREGQV